MAGLHLRLCSPGEQALGLGEAGGVGQHAQLGEGGLGDEVSTRPCRWMSSPLPAHPSRLGRCHHPVVAVKQSKVELLGELAGEEGGRSTASA